MFTELLQTIVRKINFITKNAIEDGIYNIFVYSNFTADENVYRSSIHAL